MICQPTTKSVAYILNTEGISIDVYINDFYGVESTGSSEHSFQRMNSLFAELGLMDTPEKDSPPSHEMLCLGIWINALDMTLSIPAFRHAELQLELNAWLTKCSFTKRELQQLLGKLYFASACVRPGRAFMSRLLNALRSCSSAPRRTVHPIADDLRAGINWWQFFLSRYNGVSVIPSNVIVSNPELFATDACLTGCGAVCFGECFHREFPDFILTQERHINELELLTVVVSIKLWAPKLQGLGVELLSDNATCVSVMNSQHSPNVFMQRCLRELWLLLALYNITLIVRSVRGCDHWLADYLSRFHTGKYCDRFKSLEGARSLTECAVPDSLFTFALK